MRRRKKLKKTNKLFWFLDSRAQKLDPQKDRNMIIHQSLALGTLEDVKDILFFYGKKTVKKEFQKPVRGLYHPAVFKLFEYLLKIRVKNKERYIKNIYGKIAPGNVR
ncbi:MAG TPA: hypothetical protein VF390_03355 [Patescibacteria group bacterium]